MITSDFIEELRKELSKIKIDKRKIIFSFFFRLTYILARERKFRLKPEIKSENALGTSKCEKN